MKSALTLETLRGALDLNPETGVLLWARVQSNRIKVGDRAGVIAANGRRYINIGGEKHLAHRLVWFHFYGEWPKGDVKQKNGNYDDCSIDNLVDQTRQETATNRRVSASSKSGHSGVTWVESRQKWQVHITQNYKQVGLGYFDDLDEAVSARQQGQADLVVETSEDFRAKAAHDIGRRRRQRNVWKRLPANGWKTFEEFAADIGDVPSTTKALLPIDASRPIGPGNFRWSLDRQHDFRTREGRIAYNRDHRAANPDLYRDKELRRNYGITLQQYNEMLAAQNGVCAICEQAESSEKDGKLLALSVDHDHDTKVVRELLCGHCNHAIGKFNENPNLFRRAMAYVEKHNRPKLYTVPDPGRTWLLVASPGYGVPAHG